MASSQTHFRSISLPSRLHPISPRNCEAQIEKLKSLQVSANSEGIQSGIVRLAELYNCVHQGITESPAATHQSMEESVELLDYCNAIRELLQMMRDNVQALQSALRRKGLDSSIRNDVSSYFCFRKKMNKCIAKSLKTLKNVENKKGSNLSVSGITIAIFRVTLEYLSSSAVQSGGWNLVSKLVLNKSMASGKDQSVISEVGLVDLVLNDLQKSFRSSDFKAVDRQNLQRSLQNLESCVEGIEAGLERLFRQLLQTRVTQLNILTDL